MRALLHEFASIARLIVGKTITHSTIFEDNKGCVELADAPHLHLEHFTLVSCIIIFVTMFPEVTSICNGLTLNIS
jgi:hypothetical protein